VNLIILNPIGFVLMEISKQQKLQTQEAEGTGRMIGGKRPECFTVVKRVMKGVLFNPVIIMTALGMLGNVIFRHCIPPILDGILKVSKKI